MNVEANVAKMSGAADVSAEQIAIAQNRPADSRSQRQQNRIAQTAGGAQPGLTDQ
jgi:hypothetical protein